MSIMDRCYNIASGIFVKRRFQVVVIIVFLLTIKHVYRINNDTGLMIFKHSENTAPCVLPEIDPFDPKMMEFVRSPAPIVCADPAIVYVDSNNMLQYNDTALELLKETQDTVSCKVYLITRKTDDFNDISEPFLWKPSLNISGDFFSVKCKGSSGVLYDSFLTRIEKKTKVFQSIEEALKKDKYSVLLLGLDSVSRSSAIRQLPKIFKYLTKTLDGYDFKGYTKVADNTFVNLMPLLSGRFAYTDELPKIDYIKDWLDVLPVIWKNFSQQNCPTFLAEDYPDLNTFNMEKNGFLNPPTDHYMRPFWRAIKQSTLFYSKAADLKRALYNYAIPLTGLSALCTADKPNHVVVTDYIKQFMNTYKDVRKFAFSFLTELAHEYPNFLQLGDNGDNDLMEFVKSIAKQGHLNNTILIVFSDHGLRFGEFQHLYVGRIENRMPFLSIVLPPSLKAKFPEAVNNMRLNQARLTSTFDLHATLRDILDGNYRHPGQFYVNNKLRGISLFKKIPEDRSCADAAVNEDFCPCHKATKLNITDNPLSTKIANAVLEHLNSILSTQPRCAKLSLSKVLELSNTEQGLKYVRTIQKSSWFRWKEPEALETQEDMRHSIVFETTPGSGRFYATVDVFSDSKIKIYGNVDRVNKYGNQSVCVNQHILKHICYCL